MRPLRILHCPTVTGSNPQTLARAERALGLKSWCVTFLSHPFCTPEADEVLWTPGVSLPRLFFRWVNVLKRAARDFDIVHFNAGESLIPRHNIPEQELFRVLTRNTTAWRVIRRILKVMELQDVAWLKRIGKGIVVTYQGDDARQLDYCRRHFHIHFADAVEPGYSPPEIDAHKRKRITFFARYADRMYALNPDLLHVLPERAAFLPYANVDINEWKADPKPVSARPVVLHAPTHRGVKGTPFIEEAMARLRREGVDVELLLVEKAMRTEARRLYAEADLLIDQVLAGWYGGLAVELMAMSRPVMCYIREEDLQFVPDAMRKDLPVIPVRPDTLYATLKEWLTTRRTELLARGAWSRRFVETWHDPMKIARHLKDEYEDVIRSPRQP